MKMIHGPFNAHNRGLIDYELDKNANPNSQKGKPTTTCVLID